MNFYFLKKMMINMKFLKITTGYYGYLSYDLIKVLNKIFMKKNNRVPSNGFGTQEIIMRRKRKFCLY